MNLKAEDDLITEPDPQQKAYQETVAISREELRELGLKGEPEPQVCEDDADMAKEEPEEKSEHEPEAREDIEDAEHADIREESILEEAYEEDSDTHKAASELIAEAHEEEADIHEDKSDAGPEPVSETHENGADTHKDESDGKSESQPEIFNGNLTISRGELGIKSAGDSEDYSASELEDEFYQKSVAKDHRHNKYKFQKKLVSGGMGSILRVLDQDLHRTSAMKVILPRFKSKEDTLTDFITEAKITGLLEHPNIIPVHELGLLRDTGLFFTMKLAQGEALIDILAEIQQGNPKYVEKYNTYYLLNIFRKVCDAVSFAHSMDIIHRDIKPHNIMVGDYGEVLLMDWGIAQFVGDSEQEEDTILREIRRDIDKFSEGKDDIIKGSPTYMSPEQISGDPRLVDKKSDIFLLGATLYHIFTFQAPYSGKDIYEILRKAETGDLVPPQIRNPARQIPEEVCRIIMKAMAHKREDRYQTVEDLTKDIDDLISGKWSRQEKKVFNAGDMLMREGEAGDEAYLILSGKVQVIKETGGHKIVLATLKEGDIIGEMSLISREKVTRSASVEALEETEAAVLTKHVISQNLKKLPPYMEKIVSTLTDRLRDANTKIHPHASSDCTYIILKHLRMIFRDRSGKKIKRLKIPLEELIEEISSDLGISKEKVETVISKATDVSLLGNKKDKVYVPDINELTHFTNQQKT